MGIFLLLSTCSFDSPYNPPPYTPRDPSKWNPVPIFLDEFDSGTQPDTVNNWTYEIWNPGHVNNELQSYTNSTANSWIQDGKLFIKAIRSGEAWTSARLQTRNKHDCLYARVEASIKLPTGRGTWPAFWMMPTDSLYGGWPDSGEIDIMEYVGYDPYRIYATIHCDRYNGMDQNQQGGNITSGDCSTAFHKYAVEWYPDRLDFYFDDIKYFTYKNLGISWSFWPYNADFYVILNLAIGGNWGGAQGVDPAMTEATMEVEYVKMIDMGIGSDDINPPTDPTNFTAVPKAYSMTLNWSASTDDLLVESYEVRLDDDTLLGTTTLTSLVVSGLTPETEYTFKVRAKDLGDNYSNYTSGTFSTIAATVHALNTQIEAEIWDEMFGVQTENTTDTGGGKNVGWIDNGDWMTYTINVVTGGTYVIDYRYAAQSATGSVQLLDNSESVLSTTTLPPTGGWQTWTTTTSSTFTLPAGIQQIKVKAATGGFNVNWIKIR